jgi:hypothetical protein
MHSLGWLEPCMCTFVQAVCAQRCSSVLSMCGLCMCPVLNPTGIGQACRWCQATMWMCRTRMKQQQQRRQSRLQQCSSSYRPATCSHKGSMRLSMRLTQTWMTHLRRPCLQQTRAAARRSTVGLINQPTQPQQ